LTAQNSVFFVQVHTVEVPFCFYQLDSSMNTLQVIFTDTSIPAQKISTITLTPGNYTTVSVLQELKTKLISEAQISSGGYTGFTPNLTFTYNPSTGKNTFQMSNTGYSISLLFNGNQDLGIFFGLSTDITISSLSSPTSAKIAVANPITSLYVRCPTFKQIKNREFLIETDVYSDILDKIPITTEQNTYITYFVDSEPIYITDNFINEFNIYLTNNINYNPIDLQGLDWILTMSISEVIRPSYEPIKPIIDFLKSQPREEGEEVKQNESLIQSLEKQKNDILDKLEKYKDVIKTRITNDEGIKKQLIQRRKNRSIK
jgi:hypothetical protein